MMFREVLGRFGRVLEVGGAMAITVVVVRFAVAGAVEVGAGDRLEGTGPRAAPDVRSGPPAAATAKAGAPPAPPAAAQRRPSGPRTFKSRRATLMVDATDGRAEVYLGGTLLGRTPYVGEVSCVEGSLLQLEVLPAQGVPRQHSVPCEIGGTVRVTSP